MLNNGVHKNLLNVFILHSLAETAETNSIPKFGTIPGYAMIQDCICPRLPQRSFLQSTAITAIAAVPPAAKMLTVMLLYIGEKLKSVFNDVNAHGEKSICSGILAWDTTHARL